MNSRCAIVCLTRGYKDPSGYRKLIQRNSSIYRVLNKNRPQQYPVVIWHEGNIYPEHQKLILSKEWNADVRFMDISPAFAWPHGWTRADLEEGWSEGYRLMCRFHSYYVWYYAAEFEYVMRLDEDCILNSVAFDPIEALSSCGGDFAARLFVGETHRLTNLTLASVARKYAHEVGGRSRRDPYDQRFPYTNLYVTRTAFWRRAEVQRYLFDMISRPEFIRYRWGDLPVLGVALNLFARPGSVYRIPGLVYRHESHGRTVDSKL
jgi:hypothetical protein